jgi:predicted DNA-binding WGR domain protein
MSMITVVAQSHLGLRDGTTDKVYHLLLTACENGYQTLALWGRRGKNHSKQAKTEAGVSYAKAAAAFERLVREKIREGYAHLGGTELHHERVSLAQTYRFFANSTESDAFRERHPEAPVIIAPEDVERRNRAERQERERIEREHQAALDARAQIIERVESEIASAIPFVLPAMKVITLKRAGGVVTVVGLKPGLRAEPADARFCAIAASIGGTVDTDLLMIGEHIVALSDLGKRHPATLFRAADVFTTRRRIDVLQSAMGAAGTLGFYLPKHGRFEYFELASEGIAATIAAFIDWILKKEAHAA